MTHEQLQQIQDKCNSGRPVRSTDVKALIAEIERLQAEQQWIPVTERLPELYVTVLCYLYNGIIRTGFVDDDKEFYFLDVKRKVTHWMPLPEAPKGE